MGGLTCITQPTTELGSEDTVIAQFLSNPAQVGPSESPVLFSGTVGAASTFSPLASNDLPEISAMVPPPSTSADRLGPVLLGCIRDVLWHGHFLRYFSLQLIGDNSVLFHYRYLLILDRTNWKTNMLTALLVPYIFFTLPNVLFSLIRGEVGKWIAIIAVILRLFFPRHFPDWLELPGSIILLTAVAPSLFAHTFRDDLVGVFICLAIGCYLLQEHIRASDGLRNAFRKGNGVSNSIGILLLFIYPVWIGVLRIL
ncbi:cold-regulated 413 plasma membrane protein 1 isoform X2 [Zea mays]|uniref:cold-regulated 413 plasma membrane protein 1 isoform X2 n=1 Tax=Zea mays TaxID=4577 RepID=UPI0009A963F9|nr:cold-regulated 413 plasma membrane protein 1 isoform X2 [Zea mays]|eukprot:XP_008665144.2 cold-regulated 413 plasma membrane protein 1 isoform X2 [Zea mays]